jgi:hypothetical protein
MKFVWWVEFFWKTKHCVFKGEQSPRINIELDV